MKSISCTLNDRMNGNHFHEMDGNMCMVCIHEECLIVCNVCKQWKCPLVRTLASPCRQFHLIHGKRVCSDCFKNHNEFK